MSVLHVIPLSVNKPYMTHLEYLVLLKDVCLIHEKAVRNQITSSNYKWKADGLPRNGPLTLTDGKRESKL